MYSVQGSALFDVISVFVRYTWVQLCLIRSAYLLYMYSVQGSTLFDEISVFVIYVFCTGFSSVWWDQRICHIYSLTWFSSVWWDQRICQIYMGSTLFDEINVFVIYVIHDNIYNRADPCIEYIYNRDQPVTEYIYNRAQPCTEYITELNPV